MKINVNAAELQLIIDGLGVYRSDHNGEHVEPCETLLAKLRAEQRPLTAETVTDEQIRELYFVASQGWDTRTLYAAAKALGTYWTGRPDADMLALHGAEMAEARAQCAEIINSREALADLAHDVTHMLSRGATS